MANTEVTKKATNPFEDYLHKEYSYIAEAHFNTNDTISTFFKHYIALMTIPIAILVFTLKSGSGSSVSLPQDLANDLRQIGGWFLGLLAIAGAAVFLYVANLRFDAVLYARTINGIRKYFYDLADLDLLTKLRMRTLPQTAVLPAYFEPGHFLPVVFTFAGINSFYLGAALRLTSVPFLSNSYLYVPLVFFMLHFLAYWFFSYYRESKYLKARIIGIDIDGVLNKHRDHFCCILADNTGINIAPEDIKCIPVHEADLGITRQTERLVFHDPKYWIEMPPDDEATENIRKLRNLFKLKVYIFTHRDWPNVKGMTWNDADKLYDTWRKAIKNYEKDIYKRMPTSKKIKFAVDYGVNWLCNPCRKKTLINRISSLWLRYYGLEHDRFIIEKGNEDTTDPRGLQKNRFQVSRRKKIRYFVEDDLEKAIKLAFICDVVFLINHPYNLAGC